jgi:hypothetical protein
MHDSRSDDGISVASSNEKRKENSEVVVVARALPLSPSITAIAKPINPTNLPRIFARMVPSLFASLL